MEERRRERLIALVIVAALAFNYPLLALFGRGGLLLGIPVLYLYLFCVWAAVIVCVALIMERSAGRSRPRRNVTSDQQTPDA